MSTTKTPRTITLKTGEVVAEAVMRTALQSLKELTTSIMGNVLLYEAYEKAHNPDHESWGFTGPQLKRMALVGENGGMHTDVAAILRASLVKNEDTSVSLTSPLDSP